VGGHASVYKVLKNLPGVDLPGSVALELREALWTKDFFAVDFIRKEVFWQ